MPTTFSLPNHQSFGNKLNTWAWLKNMMNNNLGILTNAGAPTNGTSGTFAGLAGPGCVLLDITNKNLYINTNTKASPTWTFLSSSANFSSEFTSTGTTESLANTVIKTATVLLTNAQIKALRATPINVVAAPGAGFFVYPIECIVELVYGGNNAFTGAAGDNLGLKWQDGTTTTIMSGGLQAFIQATNSAFNKFVDPAVGSDVNIAKTAVDNKPLVIHNITGAEIAGNAANDNTINVIVKYAIHPSL